MANLKTLAFIVNPVSGKRNKKNLSGLIANNLDKKVWNYEIIYTAWAGHAPQLVKECAEKGIAGVMAVGGDGTVNEVATAAMQNNIPMGIIPFGSGNGLARSLKIPMKTSKAIQLLNKAEVRKIDAGSVNDRFFFCTCGSGFDAKIGHKFAKSTVRGFQTYVRTILSEYRHYSPRLFRLKIDGEKTRKRAFLITIANAGQYGNNAYIAPHALMDDGKFEVSILKPFPWYKSPILGIRLFARNIDKSKYLESFSCESVVFRKKKKYRFHIDGEPVKFIGPVKISVIPKALEVFVSKI